ncbi:MAG TPA: EAL domain-containing protein [Solirubrobacteraceae bacterium]|nr:EAL domain-containing protein [Solirubrobacteraceae bacterium]
MLDQPVHAGPIRVLLVSSDYRTARRIEELVRSARQRAHLLTYATWDAAAAQAVVDHPGCCVLLDVASEDTMMLLQYVRMSAPEVPVVLLTPHDDEELAMRAVREGAQDCLVTSSLDVASLRRALAYAIERKRAETQLAHQALHDQLTALPNRALFLDRLGVALERARRSGAQLAVLFLDFDNFKQINDSRGHAAGDRLLAILGERFSGLLRPMDTVARFGGDEFTFLFEDLTSEREVVLIADRICQAARRPIHIDGVELSVTVSVGIAMVADPAVAPETVIREADAAMYRAKERGRSRFELFDEESRQRAVERIELEAAIRRAVERGELRVHYQPNLVLHEQGEMPGVEALLRWQHPTRGLIAAREFLPLADDIGLAVPIGRFVVEHALARLSHWRARKPDMALSLNVSARQLRDPGLPELVSDALRAGELDPAAVCLEIAESTVADDPDAAIDALERLKATGVRIALDDFGSGAASLSRLRELPVDALKLHESFIAPLGSSPEDALVVGALVELGHALGLAVVAEGVERDAQLEQLRELGCDAAQGYAIGRPVSEEQLEAALVEGLTPAA